MKFHIIKDDCDKRTDMTYRIPKKKELQNILNIKIKGLLRNKNHVKRKKQINMIRKSLVYNIALKSINNVKNNRNLSITQLEKKLK